MGNPFTTLETLIRSLVQAMGGLTAAVKNAAPVTSSQPANQFLASPSTGAGTPGFRDIVTADIQTAADSRYAQLAGNSSQVFNVAYATAASEAPQLSQAIGAGAIDYTNKTASRALGTVYTNSSSGRVLAVAVNLNCTAAPGAAYASVGGIPVHIDIAAQTTGFYGLFFLVPPLASYEVTVLSGTISLDGWEEL